MHHTSKHGFAGTIGGVPAIDELEFVGGHPALDFVNTLDVEDAVDGFGSPAALRSWLVERGLVSRRPSDADKRRLVLSLTPAGRALRKKAVYHFLGSDIRGKTPTELAYGKRADAHFVPSSQTTYAVLSTGKPFISNEHSPPALCALMAGAGHRESVMPLMFSVVFPGRVSS